MSHYTIENVIFSVVALACVVTFFKNKSVSIALGLSLLSGIVLPLFDAMIYHPFSYLLSAIICLIDFDDWKTVKNPEDNEVGYALCYIYCIRAMISAPIIMGFNWTEFVWVLSMLMLSIQLLLALGEVFGYGSKINSNLSNFRCRINSAIFQ